MYLGKWFTCVIYLFPFLDPIFKHQPQRTTNKTTMNAEKKRNPENLTYQWVENLWFPWGCNIRKVISDSVSVKRQHLAETRYLQDFTLYSWLTHHLHIKALPALFQKVSSRLKSDQKPLYFTHLHKVCFYILYMSNYFTTEMQCNVVPQNLLALRYHCHFWS